MGSQVQKEKTAPQEQAPNDPKPTDLKDKGEEIKAKADDIIDQIDDLLEENAETFIKNYIQKGGQ